MSFEEPVAGDDDFARIRARGKHSLFGNGETRHSVKALIADVPLEDTADERVFLRLGDALAVCLPMATFATKRCHSVLIEVIKAEKISRMLGISRKLMAQVWGASGDATTARCLGGYLGDVPKALAGASDEDRAALTLTDADFETVHGLRASPGAPLRFTLSLEIDDCHPGSRIQWDSSQVLHLHM